MNDLGEGLLYFAVFLFSTTLHEAAHAWAAFRGGELTAFMGGCDIDLRQAAIHGEAVIDVFAMWGGIDIRVPDDWRVIGRVTPIMGGFEDKTRPPRGAAAHTLVIRGFVLMGGVEVKN